MDFRYVWCNVLYCIVLKKTIGPDSQQAVSPVEKRNVNAMVGMILQGLLAAFLYHFN